MSTTPWYDNPISVPYGNKNYDVALGGSHDLDVRTPLNTPVTAPASGTISSIETGVPWGQQVTVKFDTPYNGVPYYALLHLGSITRGLAVGQHINQGDLIGTSGGANSVSTAQGTFVDDPSQSSGPQTGLALTLGPDYGFGAGWASIQSKLDPTPLLNMLKSGTSPVINDGQVQDQCPSPSLTSPSSFSTWLSCNQTSLMNGVKKYGEMIAFFLIAVLIIILGFMLVAGKQIAQDTRDVAKVAAF